MAETFRVGETSQYPQVIALVQQLGMQGKTLDYAVVDKSGNVHAFRPLGESLVINVVKSQEAPAPTAGVIDSLFKNRDFTGGLEFDSYNRQLAMYSSQRQGLNTRNLWFIGGIGIILLVALYARKGAR